MSPVELLQALSALSGIAMILIGSFWLKSFLKNILA